MRTLKKAALIGLVATAIGATSLSSEVHAEELPENERPAINQLQKRFQNKVKDLTEEERKELKAERQKKNELKGTIAKEIINISNGVQITLTSNNTEAIEMLQTKEQRKPHHEDVTITTENLTNGVRITITTTDENKVEQIQNRASKQKQTHRKFKHRRGKHQ
jgi:hypothetical protein